MDLLTDEQRRQMLVNGHPDNSGKDHYPVVKLCLEGAHGVWLLTELNPDHPDIAFGLCDLGLGFPELGSVSLGELEAFADSSGTPVANASGWTARYPLSVYAKAARLLSMFTEDAHMLGIATLDHNMPSPHRSYPFPP